MLSMINRGKLDQATQEEFEHLIARLRGFLSQSFDEDGNLIVADPNLAVTPVGGLMPFAGAAPPVGWLLCNGAQVSRVNYKSLFDVIGTTWGAGDGATTFGLPDMRGRSPIGAGQGAGLTFRALGGAVGIEAVQLTTPQMPDHAHDINDPGHRHRVFTSNPAGVGQASIGYGGAGGAIYRDENELGTKLIEPSLTNITSTAGKGNDQAHENMQPSLAVNYLIFAGV